MLELELLSISLSGLTFERPATKLGIVIRRAIQTTCQSMCDISQASLLT